MSKINSISEKDKIIAAATAMLARQHGKRKTTMAELAKVADEHYGNLVKLSNSGTLSTRDEMRTSLRQRADLGRNFYAFGLYTVMVVYQNDPEMQEIRQREIGYYENLLKRGMKKGEFRKVDARATAELIIDTVDGITNIHLSRHDEANNTFDDVYPRLVAAGELLVAAVVNNK
jgi:QacR-like protein, C-terminal region